MQIISVISYINYASLNDNVVGTVYSGSDLRLVVPEIKPVSFYVVSRENELLFGLRKGRVVVRKNCVDVISDCQRVGVRVHCICRFTVGGLDVASYRTERPLPDGRNVSCKSRVTVVVGIGRIVYEKPHAALAVSPTVNYRIVENREVLRCAVLRDEISQSLRTSQPCKIQNGTVGRVYQIPHALKNTVARIRDCVSVF